MPRTWYLCALWLSCLGCPEDPSPSTDAGSDECPPSEDCSADQLECGPVVQGGRCVRHCGGCTAPETCGAVLPNQCDCLEPTCEDLGYECGPLVSPCTGLEINCGTCAEGLTCGGAGVEHQCGHTGNLGESCDEGDRVCATGLTCCGRRIKTCQDATNGCPPLLPDITIEREELDRTLLISDDFFGPSDCAVSEGCVIAGQRRLMKFSTKALNIGDGDLNMGDPYIDSTGFNFHMCHMHWHYEGWITHRLRDMSGTVLAESPKISFGLEDIGRWDMSPGVNPEPRFLTSGDQGIQAGWYDIYDADTWCQWVDITGLTPGQYILELEVNPDHRFQESNYLNNVTTTTVTVP